MNDILLSGISGIPELTEGGNVADAIAARTQFQQGDVLVIASQFVAVAEGQAIPVDADNDEARQALIASQSVRVLRTKEDLQITESPHGFICENGGVDWSYLRGHALPLPRDPDRSAFKARERLRAITGVDIAVIISYRFARAWRNGAVGVALGCCGITPVLTNRHSEICVVDELASAASLAMGLSTATQAVLIRGVAPDLLDMTLAGVRTDVVQKPADMLFR
jgi:coenzyme F420-0:L-glutamate ligase/coenzyme F420-1:gamma-L-glutamate ligase